MSGSDLLRELRGAGLHVYLEGERVHVGPSNLLSDEQRQLIRRYKLDLVEALRGKHSTQIDSLGWERLRYLASSLGRVVSDGRNRYQLWGITPRGAVCFDGLVLRTLDYNDVCPVD